MTSSTRYHQQHCYDVRLNIIIGKQITWQFCVSSLFNITTNKCTLSLLFRRGNQKLTIQRNYSNIGYTRRRKTKHHYTQAITKNINTT